jgi:hypothetical protein
MEQSLESAMSHRTRGTKKGENCDNKTSRFLRIYYDDRKGLSKIPDTLEVSAVAQQEPLSLRSTTHAIPRLLGLLSPFQDCSIES